MKKNPSDERYEESYVEEAYIEPSPAYRATSSVEALEPPTTSRKLRRSHDDDHSKGSNSSRSSPRNSKSTYDDDIAAMKKSPPLTKKQSPSSRLKKVPATSGKTSKNREQTIEPSSPVAASPASSTAMRMMQEYDAKNSRRSHDDDSDIMALKNPAGRRGVKNRDASRGTPRSTTSRRNSEEDEDLATAKLPRSRPVAFDPQARSDPPGHSSRELKSSDRSLGSGQRKKERAVATAEAEIIEGSGLQWSPAITSDRSGTSGQIALPIASLAEPTSLGGMGEPVTAAEISESRVLPAGRDTVSSYNAGVPQQDDAPTRTAEASVLSFCTVPSVDAMGSYVIEAAPVDPRFAVSSSANKANQFDKGYSRGFQDRQNQAMLEQQKLQLEQDFVRREEKKKKDLDGADKKDLDEKAKMQKSNEKHHPSDRTKKANRMHQLSKIPETGESSSDLTTVHHKNTRSTKKPVSPSSSSKQKQKKEPDLPPPKEKKCCLMALLGA